LRFTAAHSEKFSTFRSLIATALFAVDQACAMDVADDVLEAEIGAFLRKADLYSVSKKQVRKHLEQHFGESFGVKRVHRACSFELVWSMCNRANEAQKTSMPAFWF
jgi:hypothetical protein